MLSGIAGSFLLLLGARLLMGAAEGGVMPVSHAMIVSEVKPKWRGTAMGVGQNLGSNLLGSTAAPLILVPIAIAYTWREGFFFAAIPGLISAGLIWFTLREPPKGLENEGQPRAREGHHQAGAGQPQRADLHADRHPAGQLSRRHLGLHAAVPDPEASGSTRR